MNTQAALSDAIRAAAAAALRTHREALGAKLAALVAQWSKYAAQYNADPTAFAETESVVLVDYMAGLIESGDEHYRHLYIGEKAKQFHDPAVPDDERRARELRLLDDEHTILRAAIVDHPPAAALLDAHFAEIKRVLTDIGTAELNALFIGDCLYLDVIAFLTALALADGVRLRPTFVTSHDAAEVCTALGRLADRRFDAVFYSPFTYAFVADYELLQRPRAAVLPWRAQGHVAAAVAAGERIFDTAADLFDCPIITHLPACFMRNGGTTKEWLREVATGPARRAAVRMMRKSLTQRAQTRRDAGQVIALFDEETSVGAVGARAAGRYLYQSFLQHPARFGALVAERYRDIVYVLARILKRKLVVCDLDNTLWAGVIGEGLGIQHHHDRQQPLLRLKERGVVLAINSKNDPAKVRWDGAAGDLSLEDFVSRQINWDPKSINMQRIADHLNLKAKDFVFIDDRADERAMIGETFPAILALDALDARSWRLLDLWADLLPARPGADRTEFYRQRDARQSFIAAETETSTAQRDELFGSLGLVLTVREADVRDVARVTDLVNRTNQFNMAGSRVTSRQVDEWVASDTTRVLVADALDRFGTMGTISVLIAEQTDAGASIPIFVLSCRVFGYGMELALLETVRGLVGASGTLFGHFQETGHNQPCHGVYADAGFVRTESGWQRQTAGAAIVVPAWLKVELPRSIRSFDRPVIGHPIAAAPAH